MPTTFITPWATLPTSHGNNRHFARGTRMLTCRPWLELETLAFATIRIGRPTCFSATTARWPKFGGYLAGFVVSRQIFAGDASGRPEREILNLAVAPHSAGRALPRFSCNLSSVRMPFSCSKYVSQTRSPRPLREARIRRNFAAAIITTILPRRPLSCNASSFSLRFNKIPRHN